MSSDHQSQYELIDAQRSPEDHLTNHRVGDIDKNDLHISAPIKLSYLNITREPTEEPLSRHNIFHSESAAIRNDLKRVLLVSIGHLIPVAISIVILQLSIRNVYWRSVEYEPGQTSNILAVMQVVAKAHELLLVGSLSLILLHYLREELYTSGLPFVLFTTGYRVVFGNLLHGPDLWH